MDRWVRRCLGVRARRAYGRCVARVRDVARGRAPAFPGEISSLKLISNRFSLNFQTKVHLLV
jgi:hypothetical protein